MGGKCRELGIIGKFGGRNNRKNMRFQRIVIAICFFPFCSYSAIKEEDNYKNIGADKIVKAISVQSKIELNDCSTWTKIVSDKFTGRSYTAGKNYIVVSNSNRNKSLNILLMLGSDNGVIFSTQVVGAGICIDEGAKIYILFTDNSKLLLSNRLKFNCKGNATVYLGGALGNKSELLELISKRIQSIRVVTRDGNVDNDFTSNNQEEFYNQINCLVK